MKSSTFALVASFATTIIASPLHMHQHVERQDVTYVTKTDVHVDDVQVTKYVYADEAEATNVVTVTASSDASSSSAESHHGGNQRNGGNHHWSWSQGGEQSAFSAPAFSAPAEQSPPVVVSTPSTPTPSPQPITPTTTPSTTPTPTPTPSPSPSSPQAPAANNPGTATQGMDYKTVQSPYPQPSTWTNQAPEAYNSFDGTVQMASLNATNKWRGMFQASPVVWNYTIEQQILDFNHNSSTKCAFEHNTIGVGQNIATNYGSPMEAIDGWGNEYNSVNFKNVDWDESTGHFTQLVWQDTTSIGCAAINCDGIPAPPGKGHADGWFYVCNYWPTGNMLGEFPQNVKSKTS